MYVFCFLKEEKRNPLSAALYIANLFFSRRLSLILCSQYNTIKAL